MGIKIDAHPARKPVLLLVVHVFRELAHTSVELESFHHLKTRFNFRGPLMALRKRSECSARSNLAHLTQDALGFLQAHLVQLSRRDVIVAVELHHGRVATLWSTQAVDADLRSKVQTVNLKQIFQSNGGMQLDYPKTQTRHAHFSRNLCIPAAWEESLC